MRTRHIYVFEAVAVVDDRRLVVESEEIEARSESEARSLLWLRGGVDGDNDAPMHESEYDCYRLAVVL